MKTRKTNTTVTRPTRKHTKPALLIALAAITLAGPTMTEARTGEGLETASPVTVIGRDQIRNMPTNARDIRDFTRLQPGIATEGYGAGSNGTANINLRGVNTSTRFNNTYVDGIPHTPTGLYNDPSQIERVEVLRGPQGTLYGRNHLPGVVSLNPRVNDRAEYVETAGTEQPYDLGGGYKYNDLKFNPGLKYDTNSLGTGRINEGLTYDQTEPAYTPNLTVGQNWNTGRLNPEIKYEPTESNTDLNTHDAGLNTTLNTNPTHTTDSTPNETTTDSTHTPANGTSETVETAAGTPSYTPTYDYGGYSNPCPKVNRHEINNRIANGLRLDAAYQATGLLLNSQEPRFFDYNYYNTKADELANRDYLSGQLAHSLTVANDYNLSLAAGYNGCHRPDPLTENKPYVPETYYRVAGGGDYTLISNDDAGTTKTELPPIPEYKTTVRPINPADMTDRELQSEIKYGPGLIEAYQREAKDERDRAKEYREWAAKRRTQAKKARADAEEARKKAKDPNRRESSREFWKEQAEAYDAHAEILEDSAELNDHSAKNADAVAERYEQDAQQTKVNLGYSSGEFANRQGQAAVKAAQAQAAREAEAARLEAQRQAELDEMLRQSQQSSKNNAGSQPNNTPRPPREYRPDGRIPRPGKESRNETIRKLLD